MKFFITVFTLIGLSLPAQSNDCKRCLVEADKHLDLIGSKVNSHIPISVSIGYDRSRALSSDAFMKRYKICEEKEKLKKSPTKMER